MSPDLILEIPTDSIAPVYGGLPTGEGREAVYFTCRACHALGQFTGRLQWAVDCAVQGTTSRLASSDRFLGAGPWEPFALNLAVPAECVRPVLRLVGAVRVSSDQRMDGSVWSMRCASSGLTGFAEAEPRRGPSQRKHVWAVTRVTRARSFKH
jgi:hypothetical protein